MVLLTLGGGYIAGISIVLFLAGMAVGAVLTSLHLKKQIDKNPPINEQQIRVLFGQMGKKPSEAQIMKIMNQIKKQKG